MSAKMKNVMYLSYDGMTDPLGQSQVLPYIIGLSKEGYRFTLISFEKPALYAEKKNLIESICKKHQIDWQPLMYTKRPPVLSTIWDIFKLRKKVAELFNTELELVHCRSYIPTLVALHLNKKKGTPYIFDIRGFWADERADGGIWNMKNPVFRLVYRYFKKKERALFGSAAHSVSLTENGRKEILRWGIAGLNQDNLSVIPCAADFDHFRCLDPGSRLQAKTSLGLNPETAVLSYMGSLGTWYLFEEMLAFFKVYQTKFPGAKFLILTQHDKDEVADLINKSPVSLEDVILTFAERAHIPDKMHASDHSLFFIQQSYSKKSSSPTKMGELLAMGIPVIANDEVGDVAEVISNMHVGAIVSSFDDTGYLKAIESISDFKDTPPLEIRSRAKEYYDLGNGVRAYSTIYRKILGNGVG